MKIILKVVLLSLFIIIIATATFIWHFADDIATPERRVLQDYHHKILNNASQEGIDITPYQCANGQAPCLFVTANGESQFGSKSLAVRQQLEQDFNQYLPTINQIASNPKGVVVLLHGRNGRKEDLLPVAVRLVASGFVCVLVDLPSHGDSPIESSQFGTELANSDDLPDFINQSLLDVNNWLIENNKSAEKLPAFLWGMSMGGSYANYAIQETLNSDSAKSWQGLIMVSSFANLEEIQDIQLNKMLKSLPNSSKKWFEPVIKVTFNNFVELQGGATFSDVNPARVAEKISIPVLQIHGDKDVVIDIAQGKKLYDSYGSFDKTWITIYGAGHNNILSTNNPTYATMANWLIDHADSH